MKQLLLVSLAILTISSGIRADDGLHTFRSKDGKTVEAKIIGFNAKSGMVQLERNRKKFTINSDLFILPDQKFIQSWQTLQGFSNPSKFKLELKRNEVKSEKEDIIKEITDEDLDEDDGGGRRGGGGDTGPQVVATDKKTTFNYILTISNKTGDPVENLTMDYRIFYEQEKTVKKERKRELKEGERESPNDYEAAEENRRKEGSIKIKKIDSGETLKKETGSVTIVKRQTGRRYVGITSLKGSITGAWIKLIARTPTGAVAVREIALPPSLIKKEQWDVDSNEELDTEN